MSLQETTTTALDTLLRRRAPRRGAETRAVTFCFGMLTTVRAQEELRAQRREQALPTTGAAAAR